MIKKNIYSGIVLILISQIMVFGVYAVNESGGTANKQPLKMGKEIMEASQATKKAELYKKKEEIMVKNQERIENLKSFFGKKAVIRKGQITAIADSSITVGENNKTYSVKIDEKTKLRRRYFGEAELSEFAVGNEVNIVGKWENEDQTSILAILIRNLSIQKRYGVFIGDVTGVNGNEITIDTVHRDMQKAILIQTTKIVDRRNVKIDQSAIKEGHRIRIIGLWDRSLNTITEVDSVKDFSLPDKATGTPKATETPVATPSI